MMIRGSLRSLKLILGLSAFVSLVCLSGLAQQPRTKSNAPARPAAADFKISEKTTQGGQTFQSTTYIKGARQRNEMATGYGPSMVSVMQCDLKRTIQINDSARKYMITPMSGGEAGGATPGNSPSSVPATAGPVTAGGIVTYITNTIDTGERKEMFGFTARHLKSSFSIEPSPDACMKNKMRIERDGWYVDLQYGLNCATDGAPAQMGRPGQMGGCRDQVRYRSTGTAKLGYPLVETTTIYGANGMQMSSSTKEVIELSRQPLEMALFDLPAGYTEAQSMQEMYAPADTTAMGNRPRPQSGENDGTMGPASGTKAAGGIRVGVVAINNKTDKAVSAESLRQRLIAEINGSGVEAIALNAISATAAEAEAKAKGCAFILYTDLSALKTASAGKKLGGMFGRAAGVDTGGVGKSDSRVDFKLFPTGNTSPTLASSATGKEEGDEASVGAALDREAQAVTVAVRKH